MDKIKLYIFHTGKVRVDRAIPLHEHKIPGFTVNNQLAEKSLNWLIQCKNDPACIGVFVNHDPSVPEQELEVIL